MQRERGARSRGGLRGYGNCYAMLGQAKKNLTPTTSGVGKQAGDRGSRGNWCSVRFFFLQIRFKNFMPLAVRTWQMGSNMRREQEQEQQASGRGGLPRRVIRIRWRIPCGDDTEYLTSA